MLFNILNNVAYLPPGKDKIQPGPGKMGGRGIDGAAEAVLQIPVRNNDFINRLAYLLR